MDMILSKLEDMMKDGGERRAAVCGVIKSWTQLTNNNNNPSALPLDTV